MSVPLKEKAMRKEIEFQSKGTACRGWLYTPDEGNGPFPLVVMAGGWCYVREIVMPHYAEFFVKAGLAALIFDYRNLGASDGEPRQHLNPYEQIEDYRNAISFAETLAGVDPERIGIWGISYSGGHVLITGATDPRVKCIVSTIPVVDGFQNMRRVHGLQGFRRLMETIMEDRKKRFETQGPGGRMAFAAPDPHSTVCTWPLRETYEVFIELQKGEAPLHEHWSTVESTELLLGYTVFPYVPRILDTPTLMLVAEEDDLTLWDLETSAFNQIETSQKKLFVIPKTSHMSLYSDRSKLEIAAEEATAWLSGHLVKPYE
jgi:dienelactone hydrolase